jgi:hypothetical protein
MHLELDAAVIKNKSGLGIRAGSFSTFGHPVDNFLAGQYDARRFFL